MRAVLAKDTDRYRKTDEELDYVVRQIEPDKAPVVPRVVPLATVPPRSVTPFPLV